MPDDQPGFRVVSVIESRSPRASLGTLEDEIRRVGLAGSERRSERGGEANKTGNGCLTLRRWSEASPIAIDKYELAAVGRQRPILAMGGDGALVKPGPYSSNDKFTVCGNLLHLRAQRRGCLHAKENKQGGNRFRRNISSRREVKPLRCSRTKRRSEG